MRIGALADSSMVALPVTRLRRVVCARPEFLEEVGVPTRPEELASHPCIHFLPLTTGRTWHFREAGRDLAVRLTGALSCNQALVAADAAAAGLGFVPLLAYQAAPKVASGELVVVLEDFEPQPRPVSLVYPDARMMTSRVRVLIDWLRDHLPKQILERDPPRDS